MIGTFGEVTGMVRSFRKDESLLGSEAYKEESIL